MNYLCGNPILVGRAIPENTYRKRRFYSYFRQRHTQEKLSLLTATAKIQTPTCCHCKFHQSTFRRSEHNYQPKFILTHN